MGSNGDQYFNATFSSEPPVPDFQPFNRQRGMARGQRNMMGPGPMPGPPGPPGPGPRNFGPPGHGMRPRMDMPRMDVPPDLRDGPLPGQMYSEGYGSRIDSPKFDGLGSRIDQGLTNDFAALNLQIPGSGLKGSNPGADEFVPKSATLTHSASSPNFSSFNNGPVGMPPMSNAGPHMMDNGHMGNSVPGGDIPMPVGGPMMSNTPPPAHLMPSGMSGAVYSTASPNNSPHLSPTNSPLMMRRTGSPLAPIKPGTPKKNQPASTIQESVGGTTYFYNPEDYTVQREGIHIPNFTMFPSIPPHVAHMTVKKNMPQFFMCDELKMDILNRHSMTLAQIDLQQNPDIPTEVDNYHHLFPLEPPPPSSMQKSNRFSYPTTCYKAINTKDGLTYCLRRIHGFRLSNTKCMMIIDMWKKMYHPNIVQLREVFTTKAFGDNSIVFVYDFHACAETLMGRHFNNPGSINGYNQSFNMDGSSRSYNSSGNGKGGGGGGGGNNTPRQHAGLLPESLIWAYVVQLSSALRAIHAAGLACRTMDPTKILIYSKSRLRLNCVGIMDVLTFDNNQGNPLAMMQHYQQEDLVFLGKVVLALGCNSIMAIQRDNFTSSMELVARNYSADLKNFFVYLLTNSNRPRSINDIMPMIGARFYTQLDAAQLRSDVMDTELSKSVENGRLFRLLCKLGTINERKEFQMDPQWSETGDRYMLKLYRDFLFHQHDANGAPWIDMAHILQSLNKLDGGTPEKICLVSRDENSVLVVTYAELKQNFERAFSDLLTASESQSNAFT
ncbi:PAN2-PAN3 deadenylation complex subunit pan3-like isoform X1 [Mytilus edulis]|uniref:PAN2-PAN3 deadenylation complex subunit pan3-like isoform X1 n=1 Tax=Mytilus edulis TaxID=6550 RepID=UPI0039EE0CFF